MITTWRAISGLLLLSPVLCVQAGDAVEWFPQQAIYPHYIADPLRSTFSFQVMTLDHTTITDTSLHRFDLKIGGELLVMGSQATDAWSPAWQVFIDAGFHGQFDIEHSEDNLGWDGIYGLCFAKRESAVFAWRVGMKHISSHIGDEYIERTGRTRIGYTRQELRAGLAWNPDALTKLYLDTGRAYGLQDTDIQKRWRVQTGLEYENPATLWQGLFGWYSAINISSYEENNWQKNISLQVGIMSKRDERTWRFGMEWYRGRSQLGEFFQEQEQYLGLGLWIDI